MDAKADARVKQSCNNKNRYHKKNRVWYNAVLCGFVAYGVECFLTIFLFLYFFFWFKLKKNNLQKYRYLNVFPFLQLNKRVTRPRATSAQLKLLIECIYFILK